MMLCAAVALPDTVSRKSGEPHAPPTGSSRHLRPQPRPSRAGLAGARLQPHADRCAPFGTSNRLAQCADNFVELLAVTDEASVPAAAPGHFSFAAHNRDFLTRTEGMSMLVLHNTRSGAGIRRTGDELRWLRLT
jgi:hypothetical protein